MEYEERDDEVIRLLSKLKETGNNYPAALLASRRQRFVKQMAMFGLGAGAALVIKETAKAAGSASIPTVASSILEAALIVAIVVEAGFVAIVQREKILEWFRMITVEPVVGVISSTPDSSVPPVELPVTGPTLMIETLQPTPGKTATATSVVTPTPPLPSVTVTVDATNSNATGDVEDEMQVGPTPRPHDDNGNHYGQTPRAERTHESGGGGGSDPKNDDKKPKQNEGGNETSSPGDPKPPGK